MSEHRHEHRPSLDVHARHEELPPGFVRRRKGSACPYPDNARVELMIRTPEGIGSSGLTLARCHDWTAAPAEVGGVVGYRLVTSKTIDRD